VQLADPLLSVNPTHKLQLTKVVSQV